MGDVTSAVRPRFSSFVVAMLAAAPVAVGIGTFAVERWAPIGDLGLPFECMGPSEEWAVVAALASALVLRIAGPRMWMRGRPASLLVVIIATSPLLAYAIEGWNSGVWAAVPVLDLLSRGNAWLLSASVLAGGSMACRASVSRAEPSGLVGVTAFGISAMLTGLLFWGAVPMACVVMVALSVGAITVACIGVGERSNTSAQPLLLSVLGIVALGIGTYLSASGAAAGMAGLPTTVPAESVNGEVKVLGWVALAVLALLALVQLARHARVVSWMKVALVLSLFVVPVGITEAMRRANTTSVFPMAPSPATPQMR